MMAPVGGRPIPGGIKLPPRCPHPGPVVGPLPSPGSSFPIPTVPAGPIRPLTTSADLDRMQFSRMDKDGDGVLSRNEMIESKLNAGRFNRFDADKDGNIDEKEYLIGRHWERLTQALSLPQWFPRSVGSVKALDKASD